MVTSELPIWWDEPADAFTNMAADELLAAEADRRGCLVVRIYGWSPARVSPGAFQPIAAARGGGGASGGGASAPASA